MGARKHLAAEKAKEAKKSQYFASLRNCPSSPRKMRKVAEMIRGEKVELALHILQHSPQEASEKLRKLLLSAIANWQVKNEGVKLEEGHLFVKEIMVDGGRMLKRIQPAPQGRAYRVQKRSNHVTLTLGSMVQEVKEEKPSNNK
jgi:large subunit ribosomal protein L22